jgi:hypothetical protein
LVSGGFSLKVFTIKEDTRIDLHIVESYISQLIRINISKSNYVYPSIDALSALKRGESMKHFSPKAIVGIIPLFPPGTS